MAWTDDRISPTPLVDKGGDGCTVIAGELIAYRRDGEWIVDNCKGWRRNSIYDGIVVKFDHNRIGMIMEVPIEQCHRLRDERDDEIDRLRHLAGLTIHRLYSI